MNPIYDIYAYGRMIADGPRMSAYAEALRRVVKPGAVVADLGAGTGIFAFLACQLGARRVFAVEPSDAIHMARRIAADNPDLNRIEFLQDLSTDVTLPERPDVIVSDMRGVLPIHDGLVAIIDARDRLLAPGGVLIPQRDLLRVAVVEAPALHERFTIPWEQNAFGIDMRTARGCVLGSWCKARLTPDQLLVEAQTWAVIDYPTITRTSFAGEVTWTAERNGIGHGLYLWFDAVLADGVEFSNAPDLPELVYGAVFRPWDSPVAVSQGDRITVAIRATMVGEEWVWQWSTLVTEGGSTRVKARFTQSSFESLVLLQPRLRKRAAEHRPSLTELGAVDQAILGMFDGRTSLAEVAARIVARFPSRFRGAGHALARVRALSDYYSA